MSSLVPNTHIKCRSCNGEELINYYLENSVKRPLISDSNVKWNENFKDYKPIEYTSQRVLMDPENKDSPPEWADPVDPNTITAWNDIDKVYKTDRRSHMGMYSVKDGRPLNPVGRTGLAGRGILGKWGPNHAADPIVTRWKLKENGEIKRDPLTKKPILEFVAILRFDTNEWAIPGGMCDPGERISQTLKREFYEEAFEALNLSEDKRDYLEKIYNDFFENGVEVYKGYVDDPRNTDNSWMETIAFNFHDENRVLEDKYLKAGDDAKSVKWLEISSNLKLFASHKDFLKKVVDIHNASWINDSNEVLSRSLNGGKSESSMSISENSTHTTNNSENNKKNNVYVHT